MIDCRQFKRLETSYCRVTKGETVNNTKICAYTDVHVYSVNTTFVVGIKQDGTYIMYMKCRHTCTVYIRVCILCISQSVVSATASGLSTKNILKNWTRILMMDTYRFALLSVSEATDKSIQIYGMCCCTANKMECLPLKDRTYMCVSGNASSGSER